MVGTDLAAGTGSETECAVSFEETAEWSARRRGVASAAWSAWTARSPAVLDSWFCCGLRPSSASVDSAGAGVSARRCCVRDCDRSSRPQHWRLERSLPQCTAIVSTGEFPVAALRVLCVEWTESDSPSPMSVLCPLPCAGLCSVLCAQRTPVTVGRTGGSSAPTTQQQADSTDNTQAQRQWRAQRATPPERLVQSILVDRRGYQHECNGSKAPLRSTGHRAEPRAELGCTQHSMRTSSSDQH